jgi:uncharacterized protein (UPF0218 family)
VAEVVVELQAALRPEFKEPLGPIETDTAALLAAAEPPLVTVGDIVTYHVLQAGQTPAVALIDDRTKRSAVGDTVREALTDHAEQFDRHVEVRNPAGTLTAELLTTLREAVARAPDEATLIEVDGEEDLAALPAVFLVGAGGSVVYGQPDEGMVHVTVDPAVTDRVRELLARMEGDSRRLWAALEA